jgi:hypothetical protein
MRAVSGTATRLSRIDRFLNSHAECRGRNLPRGHSVPPIELLRMRPLVDVTEVDRAAGELGAIEADRAAGELGAGEADQSPGELGAGEADRAAGELDAGEADRAAEEPGAAEADPAAGEQNEVEVDRTAEDDRTAGALPPDYWHSGADMVRTVYTLRAAADRWGQPGTLVRAVLDDAASERLVSNIVGHLLEG